MEKLILVVFLTISALSWGAPNTVQCETLLAKISEGASIGTDTYLNLFNALIKNKNALTVKDVEEILARPQPVNPFDITMPTLSTEEKYAFQSAFEKVLKGRVDGSLNWKEVQNQLKQIARSLRQRSRESQVRDLSNNHTENLTTKALNVNRMIAAYTAQSGQIVAVFETSSGTLQHIQLYGPLHKEGLP